MTLNDDRLACLNRRLELALCKLDALTLDVAKILALMPDRKVVGLEVVPGTPVDQPPDVPVVQ